MKDPITVKGGMYWNKHNHLPLVIGKVFAEHDDRQADSDDFTNICHKHDHIELVIVHGGTAQHYFEGKEYPISAGDIFCILGKQQHYYHEMNNLQLINVMYDPKRLNLPLDSLRKIPGYNAMFALEPNYRKQHHFSSRLTLYQTDLARVINMVESMYTELHGCETGYEAYLIGSLIRLIVFLSRHYGEHPGKEAEALLRIGNVLGAMEEDPAQAWTLNEIAKLAQLSPSNLIRVFRLATDMPPMEYLIRLRIRQSMELLAGTSMSITEIAFEVGFNDSNYFARQFRRINNMSASEFRKRSDA